MPVCVLYMHTCVCVCVCVYALVCVKYTYLLYYVYILTLLLAFCETLPALGVYFVGSIIKIYNLGCIFEYLF